MKRKQLTAGMRQFAGLLRAAWLRSVAVAELSPSWLAKLKAIAAMAPAGAKLVWVLLRWRWLPKVPTEVAIGRLNQCQACPLYHAPAQTCGGPTEWVWTDKHGRTALMGCGCYLPVKVWLAEARCWLGEVGQVSRWT